MLPFSKMQACGNDFVVIDDRAGTLAGIESLVAQRLCHRRLGIGADGMLLLRQSSITHAHAQTPTFGMVFVNADGLIGEMCGNGARCLSAFIQRAGLAAHHFLLDTRAGLVDVHLVGNAITLDLPAAQSPRHDMAIDWQGKRWLFDAIDVGVPHAVCFVDTHAALADMPVADLGRHVRHHPAFHPRGVNVNFIAIENGLLYLRTYERGVEEETLGCGTGATAAALLAHKRFGLPSPLTVITSSGEALQVHFDRHDGEDGVLRLTGGAHFVAEGITSHGLLDDLLASRAAASISTSTSTRMETAAT